MNQSAWGDAETQFFYEITPDRVLEAVETSGIRTTGRCLVLNSMENRVYDVELEEAENPANPSSRQRVVKFYRPGRWSREQILEEHEFLLELAADDIPVIAPLKFSDGETLKVDASSGIFYAIFPKMGGRAPDELSREQLEWFARLLARLHIVGAEHDSQHRIYLDTNTYGSANLDYLLETRAIPMELESRYANAVDRICEISGPWFEETPMQRIHGDCHLGNFLWRPDSGPLLLDFDDMVMGPSVQDFWLLFSGRDEDTKRQWDIFLDSYESLRHFDRGSLRLVEALRALRFVHFSAWIGKRWKDPSFQQAFSHYGSFQYWQEQTLDLEEQVRLLELARDNAYFDTF